MTEPTEGTTTANTPEPTATAPDNSGNTGEQMVTMPQSHFDAIVQREKAQAKRSALAELGDVDELKAAKAELDNIKTEQLSELEKSQKRIADLEAEAEKAKAQAEATRLDSALRTAANEAGFHNLDAVRMVDTTGLTPEGANDAIAALVEVHPYLVNTAPPRPAKADAGAGKNARPDKPAIALTIEQRKLAAASGMPEEEYIKYLGRIQAGNYTIEMPDSRETNNNG
jgi:hypothetical protein